MAVATMATPVRSPTASLTSSRRRSVSRVAAGSTVCASGRCVRVVPGRPGRSLATRVQAFQENDRKPETDEVQKGVRAWQEWIRRQQAERELASQQMVADADVQEERRAQVDAAVQAGMQRLKQAKAAWDKVPDKAHVLAVGGGAAGALWLGSVVLSVVDRVPLLPAMLQLVGLGFTTWFYFRYVLFAAGRRDLGRDVSALGRGALERSRAVGQGLADLAYEVEPRSPQASRREGGQQEEEEALGARRAHDAARLLRDVNAAQQQEPPPAPRVHDDGAWLDAIDDVPGGRAAHATPPPSADQDTAAALAADVERQLRELADMEGQRRGKPSPPRRPMIFAAMMSPGPAPASDDEDFPGNGFKASSGAGQQAQGGGEGYLDPCLGWDVDACPSLKEGHDSAELSRLEAQARAAAHQATRSADAGWEHLQHPASGHTAAAHTEGRGEVAVEPGTPSADSYISSQAATAPLRSVLDEAQQRVAEEIDAAVRQQQAKAKAKNTGSKGEGGSTAAGTRE